MPDQKLPDLSVAAATMAADQAKVTRYIDELTDRVDKLVSAATLADWAQLQQLSRQLAEDSRSSGYRAVSALAQRVHDEATRVDNEVGVKRSLIRLIGTCGRTTC